MKTQEQLQKMTEQQLTFELACLVFGEDNVYMANFCRVGVTVDDIASDAGRVDINDWSWIMLLAVEHGVSLIKPVSETWTAFMWECNNESSDDCPQRAIAICLILKLQEIKV